jgi:hypothetical protein
VQLNIRIRTQSPQKPVSHLQFSQFSQHLQHLQHFGKYFLPRTTFLEVRVTTATTTSFRIPPPVPPQIRSSAGNSGTKPTFAIAEIAANFANDGYLPVRFSALR